LSCHIAEAKVAFAGFMTADLSKEMETALASVTQHLLLEAVQRPNSGGWRQVQHNVQNRYQDRRPGFQKNFDQQRNGQQLFQAGPPAWAGLGVTSRTIAPWAKFRLTVFLWEEGCSGFQADGKKLHPTILSSK
jgi:hypothetical protein